MVKFVLFDIDGTLIGVDGAGARSLNRAMLELTGISEGFQTISFAGKTDFQIIREGLIRAGLEDRGDLMYPLANLYLAYLRDELSTGIGHAKVGAPELLQALDGLDDICLGLRTGNVEKAARLKLRPFGLEPFFSVGAFGSDAEDRNHLLPIAVERLRELESIAVNYEHCVVVGDTPKDVDCARVHGASCIAVATGPYPLQLLEKTEAALVIPDLSNTQQIVEWIRNS